jgi:hypothetical protein
MINLSTQKSQICYSSQQMFWKCQSLSQCTLLFVCEDRVLLLSQSILTFLYAGSSIQNASEQFVCCTRLSLCKLRLSPSQRNENVAALGLEIQTALSRQPFRFKTLIYMAYFFHNDRYYHLQKILNFHPESSSIRSQGTIRYWMRPFAKNA